MADIPPIVSPFRVVWVDPTKENMTYCTEAQKDARVEDLWKIQTISDWRKLAGKKLGIKQVDGNYVRGWLRVLLEATRGLVLLRDSNKSEDVVEISLDKIETVEIIECRFPPLLRFQTVGDRLWLWNRQVSVTLITGELIKGRVEDSSSSDRLILQSVTGAKVSVPLDSIGAVEDREEGPPTRERKRPRAKVGESKPPAAPPPKEI